MIPRFAENTIKQLSKGYPIIAITGPRQSGKTTLARHMFRDMPYASMENPDTLEFATEDPRGFLATYRQGAVFDEAQRCPELFSYLQGIVDESGKPGSFVLTGSQQFGLMSGITQSLAGRAALIHLLPFAYHEVYSDPQPEASIDLDEVLFTGLYPPIHDRKLTPYIWYANYTQTYIERDVRQLVNIRDLSSFQRFVRLCAGRVGQLVNLSALASDSGISHNTAKAWISILEASYIIYLLQPHFKSFNKRIIKTPKLYFFDSGLCVRLLGIQSQEQLNIHPLRGAIFESFVVSEFLKALYNHGQPGQLYFWRDRSGNEVDLLLDRGDKLRPIEIKSGQTLNRDYFKGINNWIALAGSHATDPTLIYGGNDSAVRSGIRVLPWHDKGCYMISATT